MTTTTTTTTHYNENFYFTKKKKQFKAFHTQFLCVIQTHTHIYFEALDVSSARKSSEFVVWN